MNIYKTSFLLIAFLISSLYSFSQLDQDGKNVLYTKEALFGFNIHTNGMGFSLKKGNILDIYETRYWEIELLDMKHPKEYKQKNEDIPGAKSFLFGKQNNLYIIRSGYIFSKLLFQKASLNGVQVNYVFGGGASLGILKPYYLNILYPTDIPQIYKINPERYDKDVPMEDNNFMNWYSIYGASGFTYGIKDIMPVPGGYARFGLNFEWGAYLDVVKSIEVGVALDAYPYKVPIMILEKNKFIFTTLYINLHFGWRKF